MLHIAIVEDDPEVREQLIGYVHRYERQYGKLFELTAFADGDEIVSDYRAVYDIILLDVQMRRMDGMAAEKSIVLLKNQAGLLPLDPAATVAVIGDFAKTPRYQGAGSSMVNAPRVDSFLDAFGQSGLHSAGYAQGFDRYGKPDAALQAEAVALAAKADVVLLFLGLDEIQESEGMDRGGMKHWHACKNCDDPKDVEAHKYELEESVPPEKQQTFLSGADFLVLMVVQQWRGYSVQGYRRLTARTKHRRICGKRFSRGA